MGSDRKKQEQDLETSSEEEEDADEPVVPVSQKGKRPNANIFEGIEKMKKKNKNDGSVQNSQFILDDHSDTE